MGDVCCSCMHIILFRQIVYFLGLKFIFYYILISEGVYDLITLQWRFIFDKLCFQKVFNAVKV